VGFVRGGVDRAAGRARYEVHDLRMGRVGVGGLGRRWTRVERPGYRVHVRSRFEDLGSNGAGTHGKFRRSRRLDRFRAALLRRQLPPGHGGRGLRSRTQRLGFVRSEPSGPRTCSRRTPGQGATSSCSAGSTNFTGSKREPIAPGRSTPPAEHGQSCPRRR